MDEYFLSASDKLQDPNLPINPSLSISISISIFQPFISFKKSKSEHRQQWLSHPTRRHFTPNPTPRLTPLAGSSRQPEKSSSSPVVVQELDLASLTHLPQLDLRRSLSLAEQSLLSFPRRKKSRPSTLASQS